MNTVNDVFQFLDGLAPVRLKMDFDNVGLLVGDAETPVTRCLVALDITDKVIEEAIAMRAELIVSHHPIIFGSIKSVTADDLTGRKLLSLIRCGISAICMHTNLDIAEGGVNDELAKTLGIDVTGILEPCGDGNGCGRVGELPKALTMGDFLSICKTRLCSNGLRYHDAGIPVRKVAVMGGSGGDCIELAKALGCDTYVTSDIKYNGFLDAKELGINLIDADHFCTENVIVPVLCEKLSERFPDAVFTVSAVHHQTAQFF